MENIRDDRFSHISTDPCFRKTPKSVKKIKIDKRFQSLFTDKRFQVKYTVDKRGRPVDQSSYENLRKYYELSSDDESSEERDNMNKETIGNLQVNESTANDISTKSQKTNKWVVTSNESSQKSQNVKVTGGNKNAQIEHEEENSNKAKSINADLNIDQIEKARMTDEIKMKLRDPNIDYARGVGALMTDSSSEDSSEDWSDDEVEHEWGELDRDAETTEESTDRLAVLNMDWDRIRAVDLMVLFNSFLPPEGVIQSITIYPSQFGLERMKEEEEKGPKELVDMKDEADISVDEESKDGKKYHMERLRRYQLNRLKYYYAIIKFDSAETANKVYTECDGLEYESSSTKLDLRFVPEGEIFDQKAHEVCTAIPDPTKYEPRLFTNTALQQGKVELTWDETDPGRQEFTKKILKNIDKVDNADLQTYLASSSGEDDVENHQVDECNKIDDESDQGNLKEDEKITQYKSLLIALEEEEENMKNRDVDLEITWGIGLKEKTEKSIKEKLNAPQTPFEKMLEKRKTKKILKREEKVIRKQKIKENDSDNLYSDDDIPSDVIINDPYFKEELQESKINKKKSGNLEEAKITTQNKAELELLLLDENESEKQKSHFNIKTIQEKEKNGKKLKRRKQLKKKPQDVLLENDDFQVDVTDDRFNALFTSHHFNIDPAEPHFRKTKAMETIISEKLKRRKKEHHEDLPVKLGKTDAELSLLVKSVKNKTKHKLWS